VYRSPNVYCGDMCSQQYSTALAGFSDNVKYEVHKRLMDSLVVLLIADVSAGR